MSRSFKLILRCGVALPFLVAWAAIGIGGPNSAWASQDGSLAAGATDLLGSNYDGLSIERIDIKAPPGEDVAALRTLTGLTIGMAYSPSAVRRAVKLLYQLERFDNVYARAGRSNEGVVIEFVLPARPRIASVEVVGALSYTVTEVEEKLDVGVGRELDARSLSERRRVLTEALEERGYRDAAVGLATQTLDADGNTKLIVRIDEGPKTLLRRLVFRGRPRIPLWQLATQIGIKEGEPVDLVEVRAALARLMESYRQRGYLDAVIAPPEVLELDARVGGQPLADVVIDIEAGPLVEIRIKGNQRVATRDLLREAAVLKETGTHLADLNEAAERMLATYANRGHYKAKVEPAVRVTSDRSRKEILFSVREGPRGRVGRLFFPGNRVFSQEELEESVFNSVEAALGADLERPGADPAAVAEIAGDRSLPAPRRTVQPANTPPPPDRNLPTQHARIAIYVERAYRAAADGLADLYRSRGYQEIRVKRPKIAERGKSGLLDITIEIEEGALWQIESLSFAGHPSVNGEELLALTRLEPARQEGEPFSFLAVEEARRAITIRYRELGFLYANVSTKVNDAMNPRRRSEAGPADGLPSSSAPSSSATSASATSASPRLRSVQVLFSINEGPRVRVGNVVVRGLSRTNAEIVRDELTIREGGLLTETEMAVSRANLLRLGVFDRVSVRPLDEDVMSEEKDVVAQVTERKHLSFEIGGGASTEDGVRLFAGFGHANFLGRAIRLQSNAKASFQPSALLVLYNENIRQSIEQFYDDFNFLERIEWEAALGLSFPRILGLPRGFSGGIDLSVLRNIEPKFAVDTRTITLIGHYKGFRPEILERPRQLALQLRTDLEWSDVNCNEALTSTPTDDRSTDFCTGDRPREGTSIYLSVGPRMSFDLRDDPLDARAGLYAEVEASFAKGLDSGSPDHVKLEGQLNGYIPLGRGGAVVALALVARRIFPFGEADIPVNRRYYAGGRSTVRGYPEQSLFPRDIQRDAAGIPIARVSPGGLLFVGLKSEIRLPLYHSVSLAGFFDVGDLFLDPGAFRLDRHTPMGAGGGLRIATPIGPISFDLAVPVNRRGDPGEQTFVPHFAIRSF